MNLSGPRLERLQHIAAAARPQRQKRTRLEAANQIAYVDLELELLVLGQIPVTIKRENWRIGRIVNVDATVLVRILKDLDLRHRVPVLVDHRGSLLTLHLQQRLRVVNQNQHPRHRHQRNKPNPTPTRNRPRNQRRQCQRERRHRRTNRVHQTDRQRNANARAN